MALWGADASSKVNLLMVCMELGRYGLRTAQDFGMRFSLPHSVTNGFVEQRSDLPSFGQLGCQGFVVLGPHGEFAMQRTVPCYLDQGDKAFAAVEKLLSSLWGICLGGSPAAAPVPANAIVMKPLAMASVGVPEMDSEHDGLAKAVQELQRSRSLDALQKLLALWCSHSEHEEQLFEKFDFGKHRTADQGRAATVPHCQHHRAIASMMNGIVQAGRSPSVNEIDSVVAEVQRHADIYDDAYAGKLGPQDRHCCSCI